MTAWLVAVRCMRHPLSIAATRFLWQHNSQRNSTVGVNTESWLKRNSRNESNTWLRRALRSYGRRTHLFFRKMGASLAAGETIRARYGTIAVGTLHWILDHSSCVGRGGLFASCFLVCCCCVLFFSFF